jgi:predicted DNA-binding protein with PD1-like motif
MQQKLLYQSGGQRTYAVVLETGEEVMSCLQRFAAAEQIFAAQVTAIGAFSDLVLMYFDWDKKDYLRILVREQVEVASLIGDVAQASSGDPALHIHLVVGKRDGLAMAGPPRRSPRPPNAGSDHHRKPGPPAQGQRFGDRSRADPPAGVTRNQRLW